VLNALRHQWNPHLCRRCQAFAHPVVLNALRHQWNPHSIGSNVLVYKNLWVVLRDTQRLATLTESSQAERALFSSRKALKTNVLVDTHAPQLVL
jgi:hypothetical protein